MPLGWVVVATLDGPRGAASRISAAGSGRATTSPRGAAPPSRSSRCVGYPEAHRDEAPTWIASASLREEVLGEWAHATPLPAELPAEPEEEQSGPDAEPWAPVALPAVLDEGPGPEPDPAATRCPATAAGPGAETPAGAGGGAHRCDSRARRRALQPRPAGRPAASTAVRPGRHGCTAGCRRPARPGGPRALPGRANRQE